MAVSAEYLDKARRAVRRGKDEDVDAELTDIIEECRRDLATLGVTEAKVNDEADPLILGAVRCFVRWKFGINNEDAAANREDYMQLRDEIRKKVAYNVTVIEGNKGNAVAYRTIKVNGKYIRGYGVPDYAGKAKETGGTAEATIYKVVKGDTLGRIAAAAGTTVQALAKINGIKNVNFIRVGQILMMENTIRAAVDKLATMGVINSPDYWEQTAAEVQHLDELLKMSAQVIKKAGKRAATPEAGAEKLVKAGVITSPEYWLTKVNTVKNLGALLTALGGAV